MSMNGISHKGRLVAVCFSAIAMLSACVSQPVAMYHWGDFQEQQYAYLTGGESPVEGIDHLEKVRNEAMAKGKPVPPGMQAHLGMLYGLTGKTDQFEQNLQAEKQQFPESSGYVDFLLKNHNKQP